MNVIHKERETRQVYAWDRDAGLSIFILKPQKYQSHFSSSFKMKSWELCSVWRQAKLNNVRPDDDDEDDDYGGGGGDDGVGNSVTYEWL